jgi:hypothetical protein
MDDQSSFKKENIVQVGSAKKAGTVANRRTPRRNHNRLVGLLHAGNYFLVQSHEVSEGGMMLELPLGIAIGENILVTLLVPKTMVHILARAEVIYRLDDEKNKDFSKTGIQFIALDSAKKRLIRDYVSSKSQADISKAFEHKAFTSARIRKVQPDSLDVGPLSKETFKKAS